MNTAAYDDIVAMKTRLKTCCVVRESENVERASDHYPVVAMFDLRNESFDLSG